MLSKILIPIPFVNFSCVSPRLQFPLFGIDNKTTGLEWDDIERISGSSASCFLGSVLPSCILTLKAGSEVLAEFNSFAGIA